MPLQAGGVYGLPVVLFLQGGKPLLDAGQRALRFLKFVDEGVAFGCERGPLGGKGGESRVLFAGGRVFDGSGAAPAPADVLVIDGLIEEVGTGLDADTVIDCTGTTLR